MEANSWRATPPEASVGPGAGVVVDAGDWRNQLQQEARQRIVNKIMDTLKRHLPISVPEGLTELQKIAVRFEEKIYTAATSQSDYLRKISLKLLSMETKTQQTAPINPSMSNSAGPNQNLNDPASLLMQPQGNNQGQSLPASMVNQPAARQQILSQNIQNTNLDSIQGNTNMPSGLSSIPGSGQSTLSGIGMTGIGQNSATSSMGQAAAPDIYSNSQRQMQGRQQQMVSQQQQSQNQLLLQQQQQLQRQIMKQKMQPSSLLPPHVQQQQQQHQQQQQQTLLQAAQLQSSQQSLLQMSSSLQSGLATTQQIQPGLQQASQTGIQQNQLISAQQSMSPLLQQHAQPLSRQQQVQTSMHQQTPTLSQQSTSVSQQNILPPQQHTQQLTGPQTNISGNQQAQLLGQQSGVTDMQQAQRMPVPQNNLVGMQQQQQMLNQQAIPLHQQQPTGPQNNLSGLQQQQQQQQQQQLLGSLPNVSNMQQQRSMHMLQQSKGAIPQQQQNQQASMALLQPQGQHAQSQSSQQQLVSQFQSQPAQVQQHLAMQQNSNSLQREMPQRLQSSAMLSQNGIEYTKQIVQGQRGLPDVSSSTSVDSTGQTGHAGINDWQEEIYQKIKSMKELYFNDLNELYQKIAFKLQQAEGLMPPVKQSEQYEKMKGYRAVLERMLNILQLPKASTQIALKDKLPVYEKQMISILASHKKKPMQTPAQQQLLHSAQSMPQQQSTQVSQLLQHDNHTNQGQQMNLQGSATSMQSAAASGVQNGSIPLSSHFNISSTQQNISALQPGHTIDTSQGNSFGSIQQGSVGAIQGAAISGQGTVNIPQQTNNNTLTHGSMSTLQSGVTSLQPASNTLQQQHMKQQQQQHQEQQQQQHLLQTQQLKQQMQQRHLQQQMLQKQQVLQTQQPLQQFQQQKQQQAAQVPVHPQLLQTNEASDVKPRLGSGVKPGLYQQHYSGGQRHSYYQQLKPGVSFPISSPQNLQASSPQISHQSSPQIDQHNLLPSQVKAGTPLQSANSPFGPSPSTPLAPSPILGEMEKPLSGISLLPNSGHVGHQPTGLAPTQPHTLPVSIQGMSASPLLAEFTSLDGHQANVNNAAAGKTSIVESPIERLIKAMKNSSPKVLTSAVSDIASVVSMTDRIAGSAPGNGSRAAVGEDLVAMTKCRLQARNFISQDGSSTAKKMKRDTSAMPLNNVSSVGSVNDSFVKSYGLDTSELESTATSCAKRNKVMINHNILEEIKEINQQLIDTEVKISEEDGDSVSSASESEGVVIKCSYLGVALSPSLKSQIASAQMSPFLPLRLLVPASYPKCSPVLLDKLPDEQSRDSDDLSVKAKSRFNISLRGLSQPMSLQEMAKTWDACTRKVITEYAEQFGGGTFSSRYGTWESCVGA